VAKDGYILFMVDDVAPGSGVDSSTINVQVDGYLAVFGGVIQDGYTGSIVANGIGFDVSVNPDINFPFGSMVTVDVDAADIFGNVMATVTWTFNVGELFEFSDGTFNEGFEFSDGWDETVDPLPAPTFPGAVNFNEDYDSAWDEVVDPLPAPTFPGAADFDEDYDSGWDGT
jgi:hypothetical protein